MAHIGESFPPENAGLSRRKPHPDTVQSPTAPRNFSIAQDSFEKVLARNQQLITFNALADQDRPDRIVKADATEQNA